MNKKVFLKILMVALMGVFVLSSCSKDNNDNSSDKADYTLIFYGITGGQMDYLVEDIWQEMRDLLTDQRVRVVCAYKYGKGDENFSGRYANPGDVVVFELTQNTRFEDLRNFVVDSNTYHVYDPENLASILNKAAHEAPAKNYVLALYGHGGGFDARCDYPTSLWQGKGVLYDEWMDNKSTMDMYELRRAIELSDIGHLKCIMFHNCLMGGMESLTEVAPYADYLIATPFMLTSVDNPLIPLLVKNLRTKGDFESAARSTLVESEPRLRNGLQHDDPANLNGNVELLKSAALSDICTAIRQLSDRLCEIYPTYREAIDSATCRVYRFYSEKIFFDLLDYADNLAAATGDTQLASIRDQMAEAFRNAILEQVALDMGLCPALPAYSLSVVLMDKESYETTPTLGNFTYRQAYEYTTFHRLTHWGNWLGTNLQLPEGNPCGQVIN